MENTHKIQNLLDNVGIISKKYEDIAKITGENFNIFSVMDMERKEVKTHSAFLGELLNPKGSHGLNDVFLKLFINQTQTILNLEFETNSAIAFVEESIGKTNDDKTEGGRIDIVIKDIKGNIIVIENKIDAGEQKNQLIRYNNAYPNANIFFLTLTGYESKTAGEFNYFQISYKENIRNWLEECLKETVNYPMLREVIKQYIFLVKKLTNQTTNKAMSEEIINVIQKDFKSSEEISKNYNKAKNKVLNSFRENFIINLNNDLDKKYKIIKLGNIDDKNSKVWFYLEEFKKQKSPIEACFGIEPFSGNGSFGNNLFIGILVLGTEKNKTLDKHFKEKRQSWWWEKENFTNFENIDPNFQKIDFSRTSFIQYIYDNQEKTNEILKQMVFKTIDYIHRKEEFLIRIHKKLNNK